MLPRLVPQLLAEGVEVIVVDGGSTDATGQILRAWPVRVLQASRGRAIQMNAGAQAATGDVLWFLHADTTVPAGWQAQIVQALRHPQVVGGGFRVRIDGRGLRYRLLDAWGGLRTSLQRTFYGDQGLFVRREVLQALGGFSEGCPVEDLDLSARLARAGTVACLPGPLRTSARRWERHGWWQTVLQHSRSQLAYQWGRGGPRRAPRIAVAIMAKAPVPGQVKTRLVPPLTHEQAAALAGQLLHETVRLVGELPGVERIIAVAPAEAVGQVRPLAPASFRLMPQRGETLGDRLADVFRQTFLDGVQGAVALGADHPHLPRRYLEMAVSALQRSRNQVVLGPTEDGGYYLIGLSRPHPELFRDLPWSRPELLDATCARARRLGLVVHLLPIWFDLDRPEDLVRLSRRDAP